MKCMFKPLLFFVGENRGDRACFCWGKTSFFLLYFWLCVFFLSVCVRVCFYFCCLRTAQSSWQVQCQSTNRLTGLLNFFLYISKNVSFGWIHSKRNMKFQSVSSQWWPVSTTSDICCSKSNVSIESQVKGRSSTGSCSCIRSDLSLSAVPIPQLIQASKNQMIISNILGPKVNKLKKFSQSCGYK